jgi:hypothetical protein
LLIQQSPIIVYHLPTKENKLRSPFSFPAKKRKFAVSVFHLQQTNIFRVYTVPIYALPFQTEMENGLGIFLYPFNICSSYKWKFVVCPFVTKKQTEAIRLQTD